ncbi:hypothetical protein EX30DRAFT_68889 [Ascodesmis nigricans]|uniref:Uncharacterized protein n=1 Tax=Ascodesmis nigricans TaxID=341454 RepID=A0A4S2MU79_9PEZI|nr:hypothetical protein EX30DRAFT_68889 [Ascodesmis nigricans]
MELLAVGAPVKVRGVGWRWPCRRRIIIMDNGEYDCGSDWIGLDWVAGPLLGWLAHCLGGPCAGAASTSQRSQSRPPRPLLTTSTKPFPLPPPPRNLPLPHDTQQFHHPHPLHLLPLLLIASPAVSAIEERFLLPWTSWLGFRLSFVTSPVALFLLCAPLPSSSRHGNCCLCRHSPHPLPRDTSLVV